MRKYDVWKNYNKMLKQRDKDKKAMKLTARVSSRKYDRPLYSAQEELQILPVPKARV